MELATAQAAAQLAAYLKPRLEMLERIDSMIASGWIVCGFQVKDSQGGGATSLLQDDLDTQTSALVLQYAKQIYQAQVQAAQAQLSAL